MKKVLPLSLILAIGMMGFAQVPAKKSDVANTPVLTHVKTAIEAETPAQSFNFEAMTRIAAQRDTDTLLEFETMMTNYDLQSNSALGNRIAVWPDGTVAVVATMDNTGQSSYPNRGTGYNYYDGEAFGDMPEDRIEDAYSGWPSIATWGDGEIVASHAGGNVNLYSRATKGEGTWDKVYTFNTTTWPRIATTHNGQYVHVVSAEQNSSNTLLNYVYYMRSTDGGVTFTDLADPPLVDVEGMYINDIGADDYVIATNGDQIAILFVSMNYDLFYIISRDNGETWEKQIIAEFPYNHALDWNQTAISSETDSIWAPDNCATIAIDNQGTVHVAFPLTRWAPAPSSGAGYYSYWPYTQAMVYWNSNYSNPVDGSCQIPMFGEWDADATHPEWQLNGTNGISNTLLDERLWDLAEVDGHHNLHLFGWPDDNGDGVIDYTELWGNHGDINGYRTHGICTMPSLAIDEHGNLAIMYSCLSETRVHAGQSWYYRGAYVTFRDASGTWFDDMVNMNYDFIHSYGEVYYTFPGIGMDGSFWFGYQEDDEPGLLVDGNGASMTDNTIFVVKLTPTNEMQNFEAWGVEEHEAVNPMTSTRVYPNPATDVLNIEVNASQASEMSISVYNIMGQNVMNKTVNINTGINRPSISTNELNSGIYFVTVKANGFENTMKFIVK